MENRALLLIRRIVVVAALATILGGGFIGTSGAAASVPPSDTQAPSNNPVPTTENEFMDLERDVTSCISSNPLPGCGREPTSSSDRGGWQQLLLFGIMFLGMAFIFWRVYLSVRARDRSLN